MSRTESKDDEGWVTLAIDDSSRAAMEILWVRGHESSLE
jgi:hypothetical protein